MLIFAVSPTKDYTEGSFFQQWNTVLHTRDEMELCLLTAALHLVLGNITIVSYFSELCDLF